MLYVSSLGTEYQVDFVKSRYFHGDRLYIGACLDNGEISLLDITVNLPDAPLPEGNFAFLNVDKIDKNMKELLKDKYEEIGYSYVSGFVTYPAVEFSEEFVQSLEALYD